jgi:uncharacterized protein YdaU (DUF1376 family)
MSKAKDPAVLWYYRDYLSGTEEMSWAEQGAYSRLLNKQADKGHLSLDAIKKILKKDFNILWPGIAEKFLIDGAGNYYNERMDKEVVKRAKNSQTQKDRIQKWWDEQRKNVGATVESTTVYTTEGTAEIPIANATANANGFGNGVAGEEPFHRQPIVQAMADIWQVAKPDYPFSQVDDFQALFQIGDFLGPQLRSQWLPEDDVGYRSVSEAWRVLANWIAADDFYKSFSLSSISKTKNLQTIWQKSKETNNGTTVIKTGKPSRKSAGAAELADRLAGKLAARGQANPGG